MRLHLPTLRWLGLFDFKGGRTMRHRILMSMALLAALMLVDLGLQLGLPRVLAHLQRANEIRRAAALRA